MMLNLDYNLEKLGKKSALKALKISMWKMSLIIFWYLVVAILHYIIIGVINDTYELFNILIGFLLTILCIQAYYLQVSLIASTTTILFEQINEQLKVCIIAYRKMTKYI